MYSIKNNIENTIEIKKSKFITKLYKVNNIDEVNEILDTAKKLYNDSTHICYAYIVNSLEKCSDDGEPSGTAGAPILNILKKNNLTNIVAIVIRYFGGIKLGAGGLVRAYSNSILETLKLTNIIKLTSGILIEVKFKYEQTKLVDYIFKDKIILEKKYDDLITYILTLKESDSNIIDELKNNNITVTIKNKVLIEED